MGLLAPLAGCPSALSGPPVAVDAERDGAEEFERHTCRFLVYLRIRPAADERSPSRCYRERRAAPTRGLLPKTEEPGSDDLRSSSLGRFLDCGPTGVVGLVYVQAGAVARWQERLCSG